MLAVVAIIVIIISIPLPNRPPVPRTGDLPVHQHPAVVAAMPWAAPRLIAPTRPALIWTVENIAAPSTVQRNDHARETARCGHS
jgi:hypothetical protein